MKIAKFYHPKIPFVKLLHFGIKRFINLDSFNFLLIFKNFLILMFPQISDSRVYKLSDSHTFNIQPPINFTLFPFLISRPIKPLPLRLPADKLISVNELPPFEQEVICREMWKCKDILFRYDHFNDNTCAQ